MAELARTAASGKVESDVPPYPASWMDHLIGWIERLPGPAWLSYLILLGLLTLLNNAVFWIDGSQEAWIFDIFRTTDALYIVFFPALYHYLN